jgi:hypothetical protein
MRRLELSVTFFFGLARHLAEILATCHQSIGFGLFYAFSIGLL